MMKANTRTAMYLGIALLATGMLFLIGCSQNQPKALVELEPNCNSWVICTAAHNNLVNVTTGDCMVGLDAGQAQKFMDILISHNIPVKTMICQATNQRIGQLEIKQTN